MKARKYLVDYADVPVYSSEGVFVKTESKYVADHYRFDISDKRLRLCKVLLWAMGIAALALFTVIGFLDIPGLKKMWVALPYVVLLLPAGYVLWDAYRIGAAPREMMRSQYEMYVVHLKKNTAALLICTAIAFAGELVYLVIFFSQVQWGMECLYMGLLGLFALNGWGVRRLLASMPIRRIPNPLAPKIDENEF